MHKVQHLSNNHQHLWTNSLHPLPARPVHTAMSGLKSSTKTLGGRTQRTHGVPATMMEMMEEMGLTCFEGNLLYSINIECTIQDALEVSQVFIVT